MAYFPKRGWKLKAKSMLIITFVYSRTFTASWDPRSIIAYTKTVSAHKSITAHTRTVSAHKSFIHHTRTVSAHKSTIAPHQDRIYIHKSGTMDYPLKEDFLPQLLQVSAADCLQLLQKYATEVGLVAQPGLLLS